MRTKCMYVCPKCMYVWLNVCMYVLIPHTVCAVLGVCAVLSVCTSMCMWVCVLDECRCATIHPFVFIWTQQVSLVLHYQQQI